tara:strand:+ start:123 stop:722 length:600 start_codon:yes stop_codon:yes gene_type:complete
MKDIKKLLLSSIVLFVLTLNHSFSQSKYYTKGSYTQGKDYKSVLLTGYGTDYAGGYDAPRLIMNNFDTGSINLYLKDIFPFMKDENLEVTFVFPKDKKNNKWELTKYNFGCETEKFPGIFDCLFIISISNITTGEILDSNIRIAEKFMDSKELVIKISDDDSKETRSDNFCSFKIKTHKKKFEKVMSPKYLSKDEELMN